MDRYTIEAKVREARESLEAAGSLDALLKELAPVFAPGETFVIDGDVYKPTVLRFFKDEDGSLGLDVARAVRSCDLKSPDDARAAAFAEAVRAGGPMFRTLVGAVEAFATDDGVDGNELDVEAAFHQAQLTVAAEPPRGPAKGGAA